MKGTLKPTVFKEYTEEPYYKGTIIGVIIGLCIMKNLNDAYYKNIPGQIFSFIILIFILFVWVYANDKHSNEDIKIKLKR